ncbi:MAG TPA: LapA family protein [Syntrophobacteria bacterium]|nr:LapA family protein [Syntrophobacteria bacterium]
MTPRSIALVVVFFLFAVFVVQNVEVMDVNFLFWHVGASRALVLIGTFGFGLLAGWLTVWLRRRERRAAGGVPPERPREAGTGQGGTGESPGHEGRRGGPPPQP